MKFEYIWLGHFSFLKKIPLACLGRFHHFENTKTCVQISVNKSLISSWSGFTFSGSETPKKTSISNLPEWHTINELILARIKKELFL